MITRETWSQEEEPLYLEKVYYYHNDHLGTAMKLTNEAGEVKWDTNYVPFGWTFGTNSSGVTNYFRFPGQYEDELTALYYNHHRYYVPDTGRYNRVDPMDITPGSISDRAVFPIFGYNPYNYTGNNPVIYSDPSGLDRYEMCSRFSNLIMRHICMGIVDWACTKAPGYCCYVDYLNCVGKQECDDKAFERKVQLCHKAHLSKIKFPEH